MRLMDSWKNFKLGEELGVSGTFIYNGLRCFHEMDTLENADELFEFLYNLSIGFERLLKIAIIISEHNTNLDQNAFEKSLITHNHLELFSRLKQSTQINLGKPHIELLGLLSAFYKTYRYDRFSLSSLHEPSKEQRALFTWLSKYLDAEFLTGEYYFGNCNNDRCRNFVQKCTLKVSTELYRSISDHARSANLYTYELRYGSKSASVFMGKFRISDEDVLWKELLVFLMNTQAPSEYLSFLRSIEPLEFDPAFVGDYLDCFKSSHRQTQVMDELEYLYSELDSVRTRLELMQNIGAQGISFDLDCDESED